MPHIRIRLYKYAEYNSERKFALPDNIHTATYLMVLHKAKARTPTANPLNLIPLSTLSDCPEFWLKGKKNASHDRKSEEGGGDGDGK